jgi:hypothetical protein
MSEHRTITFKLTGQSPLLMHRDNIEFADYIKAWRDENSKPGSPKGDDRHPPFTWTGYLYHDEGEDAQVSLFHDVLMACLVKAGALVPNPERRAGTTFKKLIAGAIYIPDFTLPMTFAGGAPVMMKDIEAIKDKPKFTDHLAAVKDLGFSLLVKRAKVGQAKHVRVRPQFNEWAASGSLIVTSKELTEKAIRSIFEKAGSEVGIGDWRPGSPQSPGPYGRFNSEIEIS